MFLITTEGNRGILCVTLRFSVLLCVTLFINLQMQKLLNLILKNKQYENNSNCSRRRFI